MNSAEEIGTAIGVAALAALSALWAGIRRKRKHGGTLGASLFPAIRLRGYLSLRANQRKHSARPSVEPEPFEDRDTHRPPKKRPPDSE